jgi:hypothetical protein
VLPLTCGLATTERPSALAAAFLCSSSLVSNTKAGWEHSLRK